MLRFLLPRASFAACRCLADAPSCRRPGADRPPRIPTRRRRGEGRRALASAISPGSNGNNRQQKTGPDTLILRRDFMLDVNYTASTKSPHRQHRRRLDGALEQQRGQLAFLGSRRLQYEARAARAMMNAFGCPLDDGSRATTFSTNRGQFDLQTASVTCARLRRLPLDVLNGIKTRLAGISCRTWAPSVRQLRALDVPAVVHLGHTRVLHGIRMQLFTQRRQLKNSRAVSINGWQTYGIHRDARFGTQSPYRTVSGYRSVERLRLWTHRTTGEHAIPPRPRCKCVTTRGPFEQALHRRPRFSLTGGTRR